ncbi:sensor histidine kinase [Paenibacillus montanisoli]|uniref:Two-component sensor histidine kinase n=1 Tax=Paenibacillus montanisoli TaxID=2081970 RepID=A0A328TXE6_9BACL|nr:histidine kinase [Paenibacillus montanisoli]RAP75148.1 two-component sensor histidine kinase [Paenibacillus montanisoli]
MISWNSIRFKLIVAVLIILVPLISLLIYLSDYAVYVVRNQIAESNYNLVSLYMGQIDNSLDVVDEYLINLMLEDEDGRDLQYFATDSDRYHLAITRLSNKITNILSYQPIDGFFIYSASGQDYIGTSSAKTTFEERQYVRSTIEQMAKNDENSNMLYEKGWFVQRFNTKYYLFRLLKKDNTFVGAWIKMDNLMIPLRLINIGDKGASLFVSDHDEPIVNPEFVSNNQIDLSKDIQKNYYLTGTDNRYLAVGKHSSKGDFSLFAFIPDEKILENLPVLQKIIVFIPLGSVILLPVCILLLRKSLLVPIKRLLKAMERIRDGNLDARIPPFSTSNEFQIVNDTFNKMMSQIQELKNNVYEEQLNKQRAELQHLQLQINPHFYMNSLNILYTLARTRNISLMEEMSLCLIQYFRYMFRSNLTFVALEDELKHIRNYIQIQELRFPDYLKCEIAAPEFILSTPLPPLVIQTFVENTVKHAVTMDEPILLTIRVELYRMEDEPYLLITIRDTGKGFNADVLREIRKGNRIVDEEGDHIGIWNVQQRLQLLYQNRAQVLFANAAPSGAVVEVLLPLQPDIRNREI